LANPTSVVEVIVQEEIMFPLLVLFHIHSLRYDATTTLALNAPNKASLKTTIPMFIIKQWGLKSGDQLDWSFSLLDNEMIVVVRKAWKVNTRTNYCG
jgi:hypothetical protein